MNNDAQLVRDAYADFSAGNLAGVLDRCATDVTWESVGPLGVLPIFGRHSGRSGVQAFFDGMLGSGDFEAFEPQEFHAVDGKVFVLGHSRYTVKGGNRIDSDWVHIFTIEDGKITGFREFFDTAQAVAARR